MKNQIESKGRKNEKGVALVIAIFSLMLISAIAVGMIIMSGSEAAIAGNYKISTTSFYAAYAGLEEGRGRFWTGHPNNIVAGVGAFVPQPMAVGQVRYILNPSAGENVTPLTAGSAYYDSEYTTEFGANPTAATTQTTASISGNLVAGVPGPLFKWVRITPKTERAGGIDINGDGVLDNVTPVYFNQVSQTLTPGANDRQVFRITALAVMPGGNRRILQYDAAPVTFNLQMPAAMTFDGGGSALFPANSNVYTVNGNDAASCGTPPQASKPAVGTVTPGDDVSITASIVAANRPSKYTGVGASPDVEDINAMLAAYAAGTPPLDMTTPQGLENIADTLQANATDIVTPAVGGAATSLPNYGSATNPVIEVVDGNLNVGPITGYGILLVRGNLDMAGTTGWRGIVLVIGTGYMHVSGGGNNSFEGALLLAHTRTLPHNDPASTVLGALAATDLDWSGGGGNGVHYDSCWINAANNANATYRILAFREITQ
ncbi:MAG: pilus assembly PilX N-terminal domain-containing protein [Acidobacteria bacterium]|nr:pilus assembly PilX N-terminal domain-containing protein [Acidobacteriota bacterium]